jgi:ABC-type hemin transport system ATPase subunit
MLLTKFGSSEWNALENSIGKFGTSLSYLLFQQIIVSLICSYSIDLVRHFEITVLLIVHALNLKELWNDSILKMVMMTVTIITKQQQTKNSDDDSSSKQ